MVNKKTYASESIDLILILGETGVGKSTFINAAEPIGRIAAVGHSLESCTVKPEGYLIEDDKRCIALVDTPGFNDMNPARRDEDVLGVIISWLRDALRDDKNTRVAGIIYLHDITNVEGRVPKLLDANNVTFAPLILATVQVHGGPITDHRARRLKERYPKIFTGDHFGAQDQYVTALALIDKVIESRNPTPLSIVIEKLQQIKDLNQVHDKSSKPIVGGIVRDFLSSFRRK